jgi:hypothetical protein
LKDIVCLSIPPAEPSERNQKEANPAARESEMSSH